MGGNATISKADNSNVDIILRNSKQLRSDISNDNDFDSSYLTIKRLVNAERNEMNNFVRTIFDLY